MRRAKFEQFEKEVKERSKSRGPRDSHKATGRRGTRHLAEASFAKKERGFGKRRIRDHLAPEVENSCPTYYKG